MDFIAMPSLIKTSNGTQDIHHDASNHGHFQWEAYGLNHFARCPLLTSTYHPDKEVQSKRRPPIVMARNKEQAVNFV